VTPDGVRVPCPGGVPAGAPAQLTFPPPAVSVGPVPADAGAGERGTHARWEARVVDLEPGTTGVRVRTTGDVLADVPPARVPDLDLRVGAAVTLTVPYDAQRLRARG
jgi:molybdate transport system ATP-binding protein